MTRRRGRPSLGHTGHTGTEADCAPCQLRAWREAHGLTQEQIARLVPSSAGGSVPVRSYQRWERGERSVPPMLLQYLDAVWPVQGIFPTPEQSGPADV